MNRISIQEIASALVKKHGLSAGDAEKFVTALFDVINDGLHYDKIVKIKGLGTFKVIDVRDRESVNVNTGERFVIEGHGKITFTPDPVVRDLVNKPFALFKEVELNEGVDLKMMSSVSEIELKEEEKADAENTVEEVKNTKNQDVTPVIENDEETQQETVETETVPVSDETTEKTEDEKVSESSEQEDEEEEFSFDDEDDGWFSRHKVAVIAVIVIFVVLLLGGGYYLWHERMQEEQVAKQDVVAEVMTDTVLAKDTAKIKAKKNENVEQTVTEEDPKVKEEELPRPLRNAMAIVNTGAYRIVGTDITITVNKGDNIRRISKRYFGDGMESYVMVHNGVAEVEPGMKLKIPKLEYKKKK